MLQDPSNADWSKLSARDVGFSLGKPMTEQEMKAHCQQNGIKQPTIVKKPANPANPGGNGAGSSSRK